MYKKLVTITALVVVSLALVNYGAVFFELYYIFPWFDILTHFWGGLAVGFGILTLLERLKIAFDSLPHSLLFVVTLLCVALGWEFYEIVVNTFFPRYQFDLVDTFFDIVNDALGGLVAFWFTKKIIKIN